MNRTQAAVMSAHFNDYRNLTVDDVIPTDTMRLHNRLFSWSRRKHIAVKDEDSSQLNAYLINPAYLDRSTLAKIEPHRPQIKVVPLRVIQYSQLSASQPQSRATQALRAALQSTKRATGQVTSKIAAFAGSLVTHTKALYAGASTYTLQHGTKKAWGKRLATFATVLTMLGAGSIALLNSEPSSVVHTGNDTSSQTSPAQPKTNSVQSSSSVPVPTTTPLYANVESPIAKSTPLADQPQSVAPTDTVAAPSEAAAQVQQPTETIAPEPAQIITPTPIPLPSPVTPTPIPTPEPIQLIEGVTYTINQVVTETNEAVGEHGL